MKKIIVLASIFIMSLIHNCCFAQDYQNLLTNGSSKTWRFTDLIIAGNHFVDTDSTCVYQISITFKADTTFSKTIPCAIDNATETGVFSIVSDSLTFNGNTGKITSITDTQFEILYVADVTGKYASSKKVNIIQRFQAP